jgi:hypothetical protein
MGKKLVRCLSKNEKCVACLKSKDNGEGKLVTPGGKVKANISTYTISNYGCGNKCKCKTLKGGNLINTLVNLSIPFGLVLSKEHVPLVRRTLKKTLGLKGGKRKQVRKKRTKKNAKKKKKYLKKTLLKKRKAQQKRRKTARSVRSMSWSKSTMTSGDWSPEDRPIDSPDAARKRLYTARKKEQSDFAKLPKRIQKIIIEQEKKERKAKISRKCGRGTGAGGRRARRTRRKRTLRGGFMRGSTRNFCSLKKL